MADMAGIDIGTRLRQQMDVRIDVMATSVADKLAVQGRCGQKTGAGFYDYQGGNRTPIPSAVTKQIISETAEEFGVVQREIMTMKSSKDVFAMCNTGLISYTKDGVPII